MDSGSDTVMQDCKESTILTASTGAAPNEFRMEHWQAATVKDASDALNRVKEIEDFREDVIKALRLNTTVIDENSVISPYIGGGYLYIKDTRENENTGISVEINPSGTGFAGHNKDYVFRISKGGAAGQEVVMGVSNAGDGYFSGEIHATRGSFCTKGSGDSFVELKDGRMVIGKYADGKQIEYGRMDYSDQFENLRGLGIINRLAGGGYLALGHTKYHDNGCTSQIDYYIDSSNEQDIKHMFFGNLHLNGTSYFSNHMYVKGAIYFQNNIYLNPLSGGGIYCSGKFNTQGAVSIGNIDSGTHMLYVNGTSCFKDNCYVEGNAYFQDKATFAQNVEIEGDIIAHGAYGQNYSGAPNLKITPNKHIIGYTSGSSRRFKEDIQPLIDETLAPCRLYDIDIVQYKFKKDYLMEDDQRWGQDVIGFIAEDVLEKYPVAADYEVNEQGNTVVSDWNYKYLLPPMLKLIQEQKKQIDSMAELIKGYKKQMDVLRQRMELLEQRMG